MRDYLSSRDSDITLMFWIWFNFYHDHLIVGADGQYSIKIKSLYELPREDNIKRVRAYFQNVRKMYPPTLEHIAKKRGMLIDEWRVAMGYPTQESAGTESPSWTPPSHG